MAEIFEFPPKKVSVAPKMTHIPAVWVPDDMIKAGLEDLAFKQAMSGLGVEGLTAAEKLLLSIVEATEPMKGDRA